MRAAGERHYTGEELLLHVLGEEAEEAGRVLAHHLRDCDQCRAVSQEYLALTGAIAAWRIPVLTEEFWQAQEEQLVRLWRQQALGLRGQGMLAVVEWHLRRVWDFALENPLPTVGYLILAVAFASERTITVFRMDRLIPGTADLFQVIAQLFGR